MGLRLVDILWVALGSAGGGVARYVAGGWIAQRWPAALPVGTLIVNVTGCFLLGLLAGLLESRPGSWSGWRPLLGVGFCGGYTTFSTLLYDSWRLRPGLGALNVALSLVAGYVAVALGAKLGTR